MIAYLFGPKGSWERAVMVGANAASLAAALLAHFAL